MASFKYFAKRQIKAGHTLGVEYTITIDLQQLDGGMPDPVKKENIALSGNVVTVLHRVDRLRPILTDLVPVTGGVPEDADLDEFLSSVAGGETWTFNDGVDQSAILASKPVRARQGVFYSYSFSIRLL